MQFIEPNLDTSPFQHQQLQYLYKSIKINRPLQPKNHMYIDIDLLTSWVSLCDAFQDPLVYKTLLLVRLSNLLPHTVGSFDPTRQLARGDVLFTNEGATLLIKWSKTLQCRTDIRTVIILWLKNSPLCPVTSLYIPFQSQPGSVNQPVFRISRCHGLVSLTDSVAFQPSTF